MQVPQTVGINGTNGTRPGALNTFVYVPIAITGLNIPLTQGIKTGLSALDTFGNSGSNFGFYTTSNATDVRTITSADNRTVLYYASGGGDFFRAIEKFPRTPLRQLVIEFPSV